MLKFRQITSHTDLDQLFRLRYQTYCNEQGFLPAEDYPDGRETDELDAYSAHFVAMDTEQNDKIVGTFRMIHHNPHGLPCEEHFTLTEHAPQPRQAVEISRLIVHPEYRKFSLEIILGLTRESSLYCLANGITHVYAVLEKPLLYVLHRLGLPFRIVGEEAWYFNTMNYPVCADFIHYAQNLGMVPTTEAMPAQGFGGPVHIPVSATTFQTQVGEGAITPAA